MFTTKHFKEMLVDNSNFDDLPEQWVRKRDKLVPYVARAYRFAVRIAKAANKNFSMHCAARDYSDCRLSGLISREDDEMSPLYWSLTRNPAIKVRVFFDPVRKSLGQFSFDYDLKEEIITIRFFLSENSFIKAEAVACEWAPWLHLKSFSLVNKASGDEKNYYPSSVSAKGFIS